MWPDAIPFLLLKNWPWLLIIFRSRYLPSADLTWLPFSLSSHLYFSLCAVPDSFLKYNSNLISWMSKAISGFHGENSIPLSAWAAPQACLLPQGSPAYDQILGGAPQPPMWPLTLPHTPHGLEQHYSKCGPQTAACLQIVIGLQRGK